jgi:hypothetical protein
VSTRSGLYPNPWNYEVVYFDHLPIVIDCDRISHIYGEDKSLAFMAEPVGLTNTRGKQTRAEAQLTSPKRAKAGLWRLMPIGIWARGPHRPSPVDASDVKYKL